MPKEKVNKLLKEINNYDFEIIKGVITKKLMHWEMEDLTTLPKEIKQEIHYLYDIHFFIMEAKHKAQYMGWVESWMNQKFPCRYQIANKYLDHK